MQLLMRNIPAGDASQMLSSLVKTAPSSFKAGATLPLLQPTPVSCKLFGTSLVPLHCCFVEVHRQVQQGMCLSIVTNVRASTAWCLLVLSGVLAYSPAHLYSSKQLHSLAQANQPSKQ